MRPLLCVSLFALAIAEKINVEIFFRERDSFLLSEITKTIKSVNVDNKYAVVNIVERDCINDEETHCLSLINGTIISLKSLSLDGIRNSISLDPSSYPRVKDITTKLLADFSFNLYHHRANEIDEEKWWEYSLANNTILMEEEFSEVIDSSDGMFFVLFYKTDGFENFEGLCASLDAFSKIDVKKVIVNCAILPNICKQEAIIRLPSLQSYNNKKVYKEYKGQFTGSSIHDWIKTLQKPIITKLTEDAVPYYRNGNVPGFETQQDTVNMFFAPTRKLSAYKNFKKFARKHHGEYHLVEMIDQRVERWAHQPAIVTMKPFEKISQAYTLFDNLTYENMVTFIEEGKFPSVHHLENSLSTILAFSRPHPLLIFFDPTKTKDTTQFEKLASNITVRSKMVTFGTINGLSLFGFFLAHTFHVDPLSPSYILIDKDKECIKFKKITEENEQEIDDWIKTNIAQSCKHDSTIDMDVFRGLARWERSNALKKSLQQKIREHNEL